MNLICGKAAVGGDFISPRYNLQSQGKFFGDEDYDKIYLAWKNATDAVKAYQAELNKQTESGQAKIAEKESKAAEKREAAQRRAEEQAERALQKENARIQKQAENEAKLAAKEAERQAKIQAEEVEEKRLAQIKANATVSDQQIIDLLERRKQLIAEIKDMEAAGVSLGYQQYDDANRELEEINGKIKDYRKNLDSVPKKFEKMRKSANKAFNAVASGTKKSSGLLSTFSSRLKGIALSLLIFNWVSKGFNAMISGMKKGFENFMGYSDSYAQSVQNMKNAMSTLGNQFAAAFAPIVQMVIPWLTSLVNAISTAITYVAQFIAILSGKNTFTKAKKVQDDYNKSLGGTAKAADKARGALAKFDDLDVLHKQEDAFGGGGDNAGADMFEEAPVESEWESLANKVKDILSQIFEPFKQAWESQGKPVMDFWKYAFEEIGLLAKSIGSDFLEVWNQPETIHILENILVIVGDIEIVVGNLAARFREAWETNDVGLHILEHIRDLFGIIIEHIRNAADATVEWSRSLDFSPMLESINRLLEALKPLVDNIGAGLEWFYTNVLLPIAGWTIEDAIPAFLDMLSAAIGAVNEVIEALKPLGAWLWNEFLQPLGQWAGDTIIAAMQTITDLLIKFGNWVSEHQDAVQNFTIILGSFAAAWGAVTLAVTAWNAVAGIASAVTTAFGAAIAFLTSPIGIAIAAIGAIIAIGILLYENWDIIKEKAIEIWGYVLEFFENTGKGIKEIIDGIIGFFKGIIDFIVGIFTGDWKKAWTGIVGIFEGIKNTIKGIVDTIIGFFNDIIAKSEAAIRSINEVNASTTKGGFGGAWGGAISAVSPMTASVEVPALASGAVIRGGNPFMAILGDQPAGHTNIEAPLDTIKQAVREEMSGLNVGNVGGGLNPTISLNVNGEEFARLTLGDILSEMSRQGYNVDVLGVT